MRETHKAEVVLDGKTGPLEAKVDRIVSKLARANQLGRDIFQGASGAASRGIAAFEHGKTPAQRRMADARHQQALTAHARQSGPHTSIRNATIAAQQQRESAQLGRRSYAATAGLATAAQGPGSMLRYGSSAAGSRLAAAGAARGPGAARAGGILGGAVAGLGAVGAAGIGLRLKLIKDRAALEESELRTLLSGFYKDGAARAAQGANKQQYKVLHKRYNVMARKLALSPSAAASLLQETALGVGMTSSDMGVTMDMAGALRRADLAGFDRNALMRVARTTAAGGGASASARAAYQGVQRTVGMAQELGLVGVRATQSMNALANIAEQRAAGGRLANLGLGGNRGVIQFATGLDDTGISAVSGARAVPVAGRVLGYGTQAAQSFGGMFRGIGQAALWSHAFRTGGPKGGPAQNIEQAMRALDNLRSPQSVVAAMRGQLPTGDARLAALYGLGESAATTRGILGAGKGSTLTGVGATDAMIAAGMPLTREQSIREAERLEGRAKRDKSGKILGYEGGVSIDQSLTLIRTLGNIEQTMLNLTAPNGFVDKLVRVGEKVTSLLEKALR